MIEGQPVAWFAPLASRPADPEAGDRTSSASRSARGKDDRKPAEMLGRLFTIGAYRTPDHDARFGMRQLVDIALKALSPAAPMARTRQKYTAGASLLAVNRVVRLRALTTGRVKSRVRESCTI